MYLTNNSDRHMSQDDPSETKAMKIQIQTPKNTEIYSFSLVH